MFTQDNTEGYTQAELDAFNAELANILAAIDPNDIEAIYAAEQAFSDTVARR